MPPQEHVKVRRKSTAQPKDESPAAPLRKLDLTNPTGPHGETNVKDKIKKWQSQGAGAVMVADELAVESDDGDPIIIDGGSRRHGRSRDPSPVKDAFVRKKVEPEVHKAVAPKKRVISDGHWVKKIPKPPPPPPPKPPKVQKPELMWTRKPVKKNDEETPVIHIAPGIAIAGSPVKKSRPSRSTDESPRLSIPERKPTGIEGWVLDVEPTPVHSRAGSRQASESGHTSSQAHSEKRKKPRVSDVSWAAGDENMDVVEVIDFARTTPTRKPRPKSVVDTRDVRERALELVSGRKEQDREKEREHDRHARRRARSVSPSQPAPLRIRNRSSPQQLAAIENTPPPAPSSAPSAIDKYISKRSRTINRPASQGPSEPESEATPPSSRRSKAEDEAAAAELRRLKRSLHERKTPVQPAITQANRPDPSEEANDVELRRLQRSLRERKPSYSATASENDRPEAEVPKSRKSSIPKRQPSHTKTVSEPPPFPESMPEAVPRVFGSRIDAWLASAGDPFVEDDKSSTAPSLTQTGSTVSSSYLASSVLSSELTESLAPSDAISGVHARRERERRRERLRDAYDPKLTPKPLVVEKSSPKTPKTPVTPKTPTSIREPESEVSVEREASSVGSGSTLRRRGARKISQSPVKERLGSPLRDSPPPSERGPPQTPGPAEPPPAPPAHKTPSTAEDVVSVLRDSVKSSAPAEDLVPDPSIRRPSFPIKRAFPTTGKRLSTIASVETFNTKLQEAQPSIAEGSEVVSTIDFAYQQPETSVSRPKESSRAKSTSLKRKLTKHEDLMSVLSLPKTGKSIASARSIRTGRTRLTDATVESLMDELVTDEKRYMRELRTLVDGVIPVLLSCVLSKDDPTAAANLFGGRTRDEATVTKPIVEMGVALERLKVCHKRIPVDNLEAVLTWAQIAEENYVEYIKTWRLGFKDVVVNLAPADKGVSDAAWEERMPQNENGDVVDENGERVDVAYLLKRPLVRLKYLARTLKGINLVMPSDQAAAISSAFNDLVAQARDRTNEERARLEDEAAAKIDPTRARDPKTLAPLAGVKIDPTGFVKARDCFDMHLLHSSGQEMDCRTELFLRDGKPGQVTGENDGDLLICEVDTLGRWLFFPPILRSNVSARLGESDDRLVVMIRGVSSDELSWHELLDFTFEGPEAAQDWLSMLGTSPMPPKLTRAKSFASSKGPASSHAASSVASSYLSASTAATSVPSRAPSPAQVEVPIGEKAGADSKRWSTAPRDNHRSSPSYSPASSLDEETLAVHKKRSGTNPSTPTRETDRWKSRKPSYEGNDYDEEAPYAGDWSFKSFKAAFRSLATKEEPSTLRRGTTTTRSSRDISDSPRDRFAGHPAQDRPRTSGHRQSDEEYHQGSSQRKTSRSAPNTPAAKSSSKGYSVWYPPSNDNSSDSEDDEADVQLRPKASLARPELHHRSSSVPSKDLPTIPKLRKTSHAPLPRTPTDEESIRPARGERASTEPPATTLLEPQKAVPARYRNKSRSPSPERKAAPAPPPHRSSVNLPLRGGSSVPKLEPSSRGARSNHRRTSSPLKHEYQPSAASSSSGSEDEDFDGNYSSSDSELDEDDVPLAMLPHLAGNAMKPPTPPETIYTPEKGTVAPSQSASQAPYRAVPQVSSKASRAVASIFTWSDKNHWEALHPDECCIVVTPGLIEVFQLSAAPFLDTLYGEDGLRTPSDASSDRPRPLVALGLTPIVPLRRGTAVDISIRSPALDDSTLKIQAGQNVMLRSRSPEECEALYQYINYARINNPTWIALQNARGPDPTTSWAARMDRQNASRAGSTTGNESWWSLGRSKSYRAKSTRAASTSAMSTSSVGTTASLFSAMRRFSAGGRVFSVSKSSVSWRNSIGASTDSLSGSGGSGASTPPLGTASKRASMLGLGSGGVELPLGTIAMMKVRLYIREVVGSRWRDLGQAKLNIMPPHSPAPTPSPNRPSEVMTPGGASSAPTSSSGGNTHASAPALLQTMMNDHSPRALQGGAQKRILVHGKTHGEKLLDVTLGESCFERVARTGIAVSVWERLQGEVSARGGVVPGSVRTYMLQTRTERECAYAFSLLGKLRY